MADKILIEITSKVSTVTQIIEGPVIKLMEKFLQQQGKLFRCFKEYGTTFTNCKESLELRGMRCVWGI